ncbi:hypothetical protein NNL21_25575 [Paenibacillus mendelii]|nr:hypothetical protein [Paenibacillus mendelii]
MCGPHIVVEYRKLGSPGPAVPEGFRLYVDGREVASSAELTHPFSASRSQQA